MDTIALSENPQPPDYAALAPGVNFIVRMNWGYGSTGTIPAANQHGEMANRAALFVVQSRGCNRWIVGNEANHEQEHPRGQTIYPGDYARAYLLCRQAIKRVQPDAEVLIAAVAPYNVQTGDWLSYWEQVFGAIGPGNCDGFTLHSYIHAADPGLVNSDQTMDAPFGDRYFQFNAYRNTLARVPQWARSLPCYMTEANPLSGWQARGVMPAMLDNVQWWNNQPGTQRVQCVCFYRYPDYDMWGMASKPDVLAEFAQAASRFPAPASSIVAQPTPQPQPALNLPTVSAGQAATLPKRDISEDFRRRVPELTLSDGAPGKPHYRLQRAEYVPDGARRFGPDHHMLIEVLDAQGKRELGVPVNVWWGSGAALLTTNKPDGPYAVDYQMHNAGHSFGVRVADDEATSDSVFGMGLGKLGNEHMGDHVTYYLVFQRVTPPQLTIAAQTLYVNSPDGLQVRSRPGLIYPRVRGLEHGAPVQVYGTQPDLEGELWARIEGGWVAAWLLSDAPPEPLPQPLPVPPRSIGPLVHPVQNPAYRRVTQPFGVNPERYAQFGLDGHNGADFAVPVSQPIVAVDSGRVAEVNDSPTGYGKYIRLEHSWGHSLYAHLSVFLVVVGMTVDAGQVIARSGNTGNSTGPHLHLGIRINPFVRGRPYDGYVDPLPYLSNAAPDSPVDPQPPANIVATVREAAREFGVDENLLLSLAHAESSYNPAAVSPAGAQGLFQVMKPTWNEFSPKVGATNILDARDNARVGAKYIAYLSAYYKGDIYKTLYAYNWGLGNVDSGNPPPSVTVEFAAKVIFGRDLLNAVLP